MTSIRVLHTSRSYVTRAASSDDRWDRDDTHTDHSVTGLEIGEDHHRLSIPDAEPGEILHLVYAVYSTADSFGRDDDQCFEPILVHRDLDLANRNASALAAVDRDAGYGARVELIMDDGTPLPYTLPWLGYFESLSFVEVASFELGTENGRRRYHNDR
jgi:hypothetical protein